MQSSQPDTSAVQSCADHIRHRILAGSWAVGDRLPPERLLAKALHVSRHTLRTALRELVAARLLDVRQGSGHQVLDFRAAGGPELLGGVLRVAEPAERFTVISDLLMVRRALAGALLGRIVASGPLSEADLDRVAHAIDSMADAVEAAADDATLAQADLAVLEAIVNSQGSSVLRLCLNPIAAVLNDLPELRRRIYRQPAQNVAAYRVVLTWLARPTAAALPTLVGLLEQRDAATLSEPLEISDVAS